MSYDSRGGRKTKLCAPENERQWIRESSPRLNFEFLFPTEYCHYQAPNDSDEDPVDIYPGHDFLMCCLFGFHRCLPESLWEPFKGTILDNKQLYHKVLGALDKLSVRQSVGIEELSSGSSVAMDDFLINYVFDHLVENIKPELITILTAARDSNPPTPLVARVSEELWKVFDIEPDDADFNADQHFLVDISLQLPTGFLTLLRMIPMGNQCQHNFCKFYPNLKNEKLLASMTQQEVDMLAAVLMLPKELVKIIAGYSMDEFQLLCRYVEWENNKFFIV